MNLHEYQAKEILAKYGIPVPPGKIAFTADEAKQIASEYGDLVVIKAQVHTGGRGKAGGVKLARTPEEAREKATQILGLNINGFITKKVLVAKGLHIAKEYYAGMILDRVSQRVVLMLSKEGGVDIEEVAATRPQALIKYPIDPHKGLRPFEARELVKRAGMEGNLNKLADVLVKLYQAYVGIDASTAEINPLVITDSGEVVAADAKIVLDDNALYRHPDLTPLREFEAEHPLEVEASNYGFSYVKLDGNIGVIGNGAGLVMYTLDLVQRCGGKAANFLDIGGGAKADIVYNALKVVLKDPDVKGVFINIFGGITRADEVAKGVIRALDEGLLTKPVAMRVAGTAEEEAKTLLKGRPVYMYPTSVEAAKAIISMTGGTK
ncbi:ADP-forming succinate--CoA ligase subunit beta [Meiothermus ruber]|uniref:Succinate--CoA ligase [ADP-forming] subunit beta n=1 Tax=Meiothermus ruber (strain ATCC 35948 / DSM 1279 / VKM B-1258 / 21) TaxID=504728 RepID=D3PRP6_MEIRD|nr:ADP-forming succinate--CoA ligase subunit beta [Meiothermus ruber]ADD28129.1 succinyl-CoA synthetase, beta subunit [Meiothermus ruber DSM 1279]AGK04599.1 succinyl-CoA synthetase subunit beta [Meiothermus ruber DSM 1279]MCL6528840.1 ADP-forming succinate--CoA ligase subunit beta [Meiothermus ruber]GAO75079.1 succinyl-CoA synthetase subunit beta [Meiothermus ruber H328]